MACVTMSTELGNSFCIDSLAAAVWHRSRCLARMNQVIRLIDACYTSRLVRFDNSCKKVPGKCNLLDGN